MTATIGGLARGRDNNFNLVRFVAAVSVLVSHSFALTQRPEPLANLGASLGDIAVDAFFITSGFLVTASLLRSGKVGAFYAARGLRIYPGMFVANLVAVFGIGLLCTTIPRGEYLTHPQVYRYLLTNTTLITAPDYRLPGVFENNPYASVVNGSLWTLPYEIRLYVLLSLLGAAAFWAPRLLPVARLKWIAPAIAVGALVGYPFALWSGEGRLVVMGLRFASLFFLGSSAYLWRDRVRLKGGYALLALAAAGVSALDPLTLRVVLIPALGYVVFYVAYVPGGKIRQFNRMGDFSYGIYIYAFPVQQALVASVPHISPAGLALAALACVLPLAVLSWRLVEEPMLSLMRRRRTEQRVHAAS